MSWDASRLFTRSVECANAGCHMMMLPQDCNTLQADRAMLLQQGVAAERSETQRLPAINPYGNFSGQLQPRVEIWNHRCHGLWHSPRN